MSLFIIWLNWFGFLPFVTVLWQGQFAYFYWESCDFLLLGLFSSLNHYDFAKDPTSVAYQWHEETCTLNFILSIATPFLLPRMGTYKCGAVTNNHLLKFTGAVLIQLATSMQWSNFKHLYGFLMVFSILVIAWTQRNCRKDSKEMWILGVFVILMILSYYFRFLDNAYDASNSRGVWLMFLGVATSMSQCTLLQDQFRSLPLSEASAPTPTSSKSGSNSSSTSGVKSPLQSISIQSSSSSSSRSSSSRT